MMGLPLAEAATNTAWASASFPWADWPGRMFYLAFKKVKHWAWESYWMVYALVGLVVVPLVLAMATSPNACAAIRHVPPEGTAVLLLYAARCGASAA